MPTSLPIVRYGLFGAAALSVALAACGGGGGGGSSVAGGGGVTPGQGSGCTVEVKSGFSGAGPIDANGLEGEGEGGDGGDGGGGGDGGDGGGIGAGGSLGQFRDTVVEVRDPTNGTVLGTGITDSVKGMVTLTPCDRNGALEVAFIGGNGATYFDEARKAFVPFPAGRELRVRVSKATQDFIGITPYTEAATSLSQEGESAGSVSLKTISQDIDESNQKIASILADQLPGVYRSSTADGRFEITGLPVVLNEQNVDQPGTLTDNNRGRYGAANAGLAVLAGTFLADDPTPALTVAGQLGRDLTDGKLDMVDANGCSMVSGSAANGSCADDAGDIAYTYETLWRAKTVATSVASQQAGDQSLAAKNAFVAVYRMAAKRSYESCAFPRGAGICEPLLRVTTAAQTVRLDSRGRLTLSRTMTAPFGDQLRFITATVEDLEVAGEYVEVKVGSRGEVIALSRDRSAFMYIDPLQVYLVTGEEPMTGDGLNLVNNVLDTTIRTVQSRRIAVIAPGVTNARVASFTPSPAARRFLDEPIGQGPAFLYLLPNGALRGVRPGAASGSFEARWGAPQQVALPAPARLTTVVYDKFALPAHEAAYGPAPSAAVALPYGGPRRLYGLNRSGKVMAWLEGASAQGRVLDIPGRVVQLVAEARAGAFALNSEGKVYWVNADQAFATDAGLDGRTQTAFARRFALNAVQTISLPEKICWLARTEAVACETGNVYRWTESLVEFAQTPTEFNACGVGSAGAITAATVDVTEVGTGISAPVKVNLATDIGPVWRLNSADEFGYERRGAFREVCSVDGLRYLGVNGKETDQAGAEGRRSIADTKITFNGEEVSFITGRQLTTALESANQAFTSNGGPATLASTGPVGFEASLDMRAQAGQQVISHRTVVTEPERLAVANVINAERPELSIFGQYQRADGSAALDLTSVLDETNNRQITLTGELRSWSDGDNIPLNVVGLGEWQASDPQAGCGTACTDERGQNQLWQVLILPTNDSEDVYGFRLCWRIRTEQEVTANIRFACTKHDNDGQYIGVSMTDRVLRRDGRLDLVDFLHF